LAELSDKNILIARSSLIEYTLKIRLGVTIFLCGFPADTDQKFYNYKAMGMDLKCCCRQNKKKGGFGDFRLIQETRLK